MDNFFDVIVVGAGHAGIEACLAPARLGLNTLMITSNIDRIGFMSCNPSIGGLAKGHIVREIDVMGGEMGVAADKTCIQFKRLNSRKGPAVRGSRAQCDKDLYSAVMTNALYGQKNLTIKQGEAKSLILESNKCIGITLQDGSRIYSKAVVITTGTFMNAVMHLGLEQTSGGRAGDSATTGLSDQLRSFGFNVRRLKTGTPARLDKSSIDWSKTVPQSGDEKFFPFSLRSSKKLDLPQVDCFLSYTTPETHDIIRKNIHLSPMYAGIIEGAGPRYCPSIEDKVTRFSDKDRHQTFLEPEGLSTNSIYLQGISTSLPPQVQDQFLRTIIGLENVKVLRYGYAVEYDFVEPTQIWHSLETRGIENLFLAGQINGTSGYEEAAGQGFLAGVNAARKVIDKEPVILGRDQSYIGVLIDDLVTKGTNEPYRMFTSRAEHRLNLREDNTVERLGEIGLTLGILDYGWSERLDKIRTQRLQFMSSLRERKVYPNEKTQNVLRAISSAALTKPLTFEELLRRTEINVDHLSLFDFASDFEHEVTEAIEVEVKYKGYIARELELISQTKKLESRKIPRTIEYRNIRGLSSEEVEKLCDRRPETIGQAQRISGVNPSAIQAILIHLSKDRQEGVTL
ncbi:MAG: tRNA uridine(34) 5-carboxymethylaminomethyl synthesis enzyme MnmG [Proteobacteria bacterium SG_bin7]|nr:MAG: tRNA uridine(34) 5-carboxymethylaminomethyl synthesis enzyme MnmG [Proteobacteria bacterium SG_bin7]